MNASAGITVNPQPISDHQQPVPSPSSISRLSDLIINVADETFIQQEGGPYKYKSLKGTWLKGIIENEKPTPGFAKLCLPTGEMFKGWLENSYAEGIGKLNLKYGTYKGGFCQGKAHGQGTLTLANGDKYVGTFACGLCHGQGTYTYANGDRYIGAFDNGKFHGQGTYTPAYGHQYVGAFENGKSHGQGTFTLANGDTYVGSFACGLRHGHGTLTKGKLSYEGEYESGIPIGIHERKSETGKVDHVKWNSALRQWEDVIPTLKNADPRTMPQEEDPRKRNRSDHSAN